MDLSVFTKSWPENRRRLWAEKAVSLTRLDQATRDFLLAVGLPYNEDWTLRFTGPDCDLPPHVGNSRLRVFGFDGEWPLCVSEQNGVIVVVDREPYKSPRFVNSRIETFAASIALYHQYRMQVRETDDVFALSIVEQYARKLHEVDPGAFAANINYWPLVVQQMRDGLL